jgi:hypothetical protein
VQCLAERDPEAEDNEDQRCANAPTREVFSATTPPAGVPLERRHRRHGL